MRNVLVKGLTGHINTESMKEVVALNPSNVRTSGYGPSLGVLIGESTECVILLLYKIIQSRRVPFCVNETLCIVQSQVLHTSKVPTLGYSKH